MRNAVDRDADAAGTQNLQRVGKVMTSDTTGRRVVYFALGTGQGPISTQEGHVDAEIPYTYRIYMLEDDLRSTSILNSHEQSINVNIAVPLGHEARFLIFCSGRVQPGGYPSMVQTDLPH